MQDSLVASLAAVRGTTTALAAALCEHGRRRCDAAGVVLVLRTAPDELEGPYPGRHRRRLPLAPTPDRARYEVRRAFARPDDDVVALVDGGALVGVAVVASRRGPDRALAAFAHEAALALAAHLSVRDATSRTGQLEAMLESARSLASEQHPDALLRQIAARARRVVGSEVASIGLLVDERAHMQAAVGTVGPFFDSAVIDRGMSLVGTVAATGEPFVTGDFLDDGRFHHVAAIDAEVAVEGLRAILGVPMRAGGEVVGVLCVSNRDRTRRFTASDVAIVSGLADHAALAYRNADRYVRARESSARFDRLHRSAERHVERLRHSAALQERLTELVLADRDLPTLVATVAELTGRPAAVADAGGSLLAASGPAPPPPWARPLPRTRVVAVQGEHAAVLAPITAAGEVLGTLRLEGAPGEHVEADARDAARALALVLLRARAVEEAADRVRGELVDELLDPTASEADVLRRGARLGLDLRAAHAVAVGAADGAAGPLVRGERGVVAVLHRGRHVVFVSDADGRALERLAALAARAVAAGRVAVLAAAGPAAGVAAIRAAHDDALRGLAVAEPARDGPLATPRALGARFLLGAGAEGRHAERFADDVLGGLPAGLGRGDLLTTLEAVVASGGNLLAAARALGIHPNTLYHRLTRLREATGRDVRDPDDRFELELALRLRG